jgi:hypothetical protein
LVSSGQAIASTTELISLWRTSIADGDIDWFILMTFTFFFVVGPVEELQYRSFLQDQIGRVFKPSTGLLIASTMFALSHLPIYFIVYRLSPIQAMFTLSWTFTMGSVLGIFYFQSRNIWGPIIMHGFWDWVLSVWVLNLQLRESFFSLGILQEVLWLSALIPMALVTMFLINIGYAAFWKDSRPDRSFGLGPIKPLSNLAGKVGHIISQGKLAKTLKSMDSNDLKFGTKVTRSIISVIVIIIMTMLLTAPGLIIPDGGLVIEGTNPVPDSSSISTFSYTDSIYVSERDSQSLNIPMNDTWLILSIKATVFWVDEDPTSLRFTNLPDTFSGVLEISGQDPIMEGPNDSGSLVFSWNSDETNLTKRDASLVVSCEEAGDMIPLIDPFGVRRRADNGNDITLAVQVRYYENLMM